MFRDAPPHKIAFQAPLLQETGRAGPAPCCINNERCKRDFMAANEIRARGSWAAGVDEGLVLRRE